MSRDPALPRTIGDTLVERVITKTLHEKPRDSTHWSSRTMAKTNGLSQTVVVRIWREWSTPLIEWYNHEHRHSAIRVVIK